MTIWAGLDQSGDVDTDTASQFGVTISDTTTDETNIRFKGCLQVACAEWERNTGRVYGRTASETRSVQVSAFRQTLNLPIFQSVSQVQCLDAGTGDFEDVDTGDYAALKRGTGRGTYDSLLKTKGMWAPGVVQVTAIWGEADPPESAVWGALKYATYLYKIQTNPSGVGTHNNLDGVIVEYEKVPGGVYQLLMSDKLATSILPRSN